MDNSRGPGDEITIDPLPVPSIPVGRAARAIVSRISRELPAGSRRRLRRHGWLLAAVAAVVVIGALKLAGVIWTSTPPRWVPALGAGVTVTEPGQVAPGHGSPGAALAGVLAALSSKDPAASCDYAYAYASSVAQCKAGISQASEYQAGYVVSVKIGYVAIDGTHALVGFTGKVCPPGNNPECVTNADPSAIFSAGNTFTTLWSQTVNPTSSNPASSNGYTLLPCVEVGGKWYFGSDPTDQSPS
jgi:hypothetical protein